MDAATGNLVNAILALLGIAATVFIAFSSRTGARHRVDNMKLANEALEKTQDPRAGEMIARFIARESAKLGGTMHPDMHRARRYTVIAAATYLVFITANYYSLWTEDISAVLLTVAILANIVGVVAVVYFIRGQLLYRKMRKRRRQITAELDESFREDDKRREDGLALPAGGGGPARSPAPPE